MTRHILPFAEPNAKIRLMYEDEAGFGRISDLAKCWASPGRLCQKQEKAQQK